MIKSILSDQCQRGEALVNAETVKIENTQFKHSADMQFIGQTHLLNVPIDSTNITCEELQQKFEEVYRNRFHVELKEIRASLVNLNTTVIGNRAELDLQKLIDPTGRKATIKEAIIGKRQVWFDGDWHQTTIYQRDLLPLDASIEGPAIVEQMDTTIVIEPRSRAASDNDGNLIIEVEQP